MMDVLVSSSSPTCSGILTDVVAYVEVWSSNRTENYSKTFSQQLLNLGAKVSKTFNKQVTHVVFKDGNKGTWDKAVKTGVRLVSVLWVEKCREAEDHVDESLFPAINTNDGLPQIVKKKRKCMLPKDFIEKTPENDKRLQKKLDKMVKKLDEQKAAVDVPVLLFDEDGTLMYSPKAVAADRCNAMERRIKEMKNKRENLSPTASQMSQTFDFPPLKPSLGNSPVARDSLEDDGGECLDTSYDDLWGSLEKKQDIIAASRTKERVENKKCVSESLLDKKNNCLSSPKNKSVNLSPLQIKQVELPKYGSNLVEKGTQSPCFKNKRKSLPSFKMFDSSTEDNDSGSEVFNDKLEAKKNSGLDYTSLANKLIEKCKPRRSSKKRPSVTPPTSSTSVKKNTVKGTTKPHGTLHTFDSDEIGYEDFFSSSYVNNHKTQLTRFSLGAVPRKSPSPPPLTSNKRRAARKRRRSAEAIAETDTCTSKKRRVDNTKHKPLHSNPVENTSTFPLGLENAISNTKLTVSNINETSVLKKNETSNCLEKLEVTVREDDKLLRASETTQEEDSKINVCLVKGLEKIINLETRRDILDQPEPKEEKLGLKNSKVSAKKEDQMKRLNQSAQSKTSECDAVDELPEMFNEQKNKCTEESKKKEKTRKVARSLVMTSMCTEKQNAVIQVVKRFGGFSFSDHVCETTTHVIAGSPRRTLNIILGIARGCWIVSNDWVLWSLEHGHWIPEEPYELSDDFPGAQICRLQRHLSGGEYVQDLLSSVPAVFISPSSQPPCDKLSEVVQLCGGKVCKTLRQAKICIGHSTGKKPPDMQTISEKWILDCITQHKLHPLKNYLLEQ
ncbi:microcephalin [Discoglossus pictus]